jgi:hypothetical protein
MINLPEFRAGLFSLPRSCGDELPGCCDSCVYLLQDEATVCFCDATYYFCAYSWPDKLTQTIPPCLQEG